MRTARTRRPERDSIGSTAGSGRRPLIAAVLVLAAGGCGKWPPVVDSKTDIENLPVETKSIRARGMPDNDISSLSRLHNLRVLDFGGGMAAQDAQITDRGLEKLSKLNLRKLENVNLGFNVKITNAGLASAARLDSVDTLLLPACPKLTDRGMPHLLRMKSLSYLDLRGCQGITDAGLLTLAGKAELKHLAIGGCRNLTEMGIAKVKRLRPDLVINKDDEEWRKYWQEYER